MRSLIIRLFLLLGLILPALASAAYTNNGDGTVTDSATGLTWMRCAMGQTWSGSTCTGTASTYAWAAATALTSTFAGRSDWRLPNMRELQTIVDRSRYMPAIDPTAFPNLTGPNFWSASADAYRSYVAWYVDFRYGSASSNSYKYDTLFVRLVRGGQSLALLSDARPDTDYTDNGDGTVTHKPTGLMWKKCREGLVWSGSTCTGTGSTYTWDQAMALTGNFAGKSDWRVPTGDELISLVDYTRVDPAINSTLFPGMLAPYLYFWSASVDASYSGSAWCVYFVSGPAAPFLKTVNFYVRLVRGGQSLGSLASTQTIGAITFSPATLAVGGTTTASATATSGLAVTFSSTTPGVCTVNGGTVTGVAAGTCAIAADQAGNASYSAAAQVTQNITIGISRSDCIFNWAEQNFAQYFSPAGAPSATYPPYYYRYYSGTGNYLATSSADNNLYAIGPATGNSLLNAGPVTNLLGVSGCP